MTRAVHLLVVLGLASCGLHPHDPADDERPPREMTRDADPRRGLAIAERWCIACHHVNPEVIIRPEQAAAPSFTAIATAKDRAYLARFIDDVHPPMPTYRLFVEEKQDLLAYLDSLRPRR